MKFLTVFGTRPEAIKLAPILDKLSQESGIHSRICVTGQHREILDEVRCFFDIRSDIDLRAMEPGQQLNLLTSCLFERLDRVLSEELPDRVIVQGDTTTALVAALAAYNRHIPVAHVEAGLRTYSANPWPEEGNRQSIARLCDLHFAPTAGAAVNLDGEKVRGQVFVTGNSVIDALDMVLSRGGAHVAFPAGKLILVTVHRRESFGAPLAEICGALSDLAAREKVTLLWPVHPNPEVRGPVMAALGARPGIRLVPPMSLPVFVRAMQRADLILSDSGGVQEEAVALGKPLLVLRDETERPEGIAAGAARLVGTDRGRIFAAATHLLDHPPERRSLDIYGDGRASARIVDGLLDRPVEEFDPGARQVTGCGGSASEPRWRAQIF